MFVSEWERCSPRVCWRGLMVNDVLPYWWRIMSYQELIACTVASLSTAWRPVVGHWLHTSPQSLLFQHILDSLLHLLHRVLCCSFTCHVLHLGSLDCVNRGPFFFFSSPNYEKDSFLAVEIGLTAVLSIPPCFLWRFCLTSSLSNLSTSAYLFTTPFVCPFLCSLTFTRSLPFHLFFPLSYSLQSPSHSWSGAVGSPLSPSIHPSTSHMPTALPLGHTSLLHSHPPPASPPSQPLPPILFMGICWWGKPR